MKASKLSLETLLAINEFQQEHDYSPSLKELATKLNISGSAVSLRIRKLVDRAELKRFGNRALKITEKGWKALEKE